MYINYAFIHIQSDHGDQAFFNNLPTQFVANIPGECTTAGDFKMLNIPNPGKYGIVLEQPDLNAHGTCDEASRVPQFETPAAAPPPATTSTSQGPSASSGAIPDQSSTPPGASPSLGRSLTSASSSIAAGPPPKSSAPASPPPSTLTTVTTATSGDRAAPGPSAQSCSVNNAFLCVGMAGYYAICDNGRAVPQSMAPGTACKEGEIALA